MIAAIGIITIGAAVLWTRVAWIQPERVAAEAQVVRVARRDIASVVKATGIIKPRVGAEVRVGSRVSGVVKRLYVRIGDRVAKGQLLAELDDRDLIARRNEAAAAAQQADANLAYARTDLQRKRALGTDGILPRSELDLAERAAAVAEQQVTGARASLEYATTQLAYTRIVAPIAGVVASVSTQEGETVAASFAAPTFVTLIETLRALPPASSAPTSARAIEFQRDQIPVFDTLKSYYLKAGVGSSSSTADTNVDEAVRQFASRMLDRSRQASLHAWSMKHFLERYPYGAARSVPRESQELWASTIRTHAQAFADEIDAIQRELRPIFAPGSPLGGDWAASPTPEHTSELDWPRAITELAALDSARDAAMRSAFAVSPDASGVSALQADDFWKVLANSLEWANAIQQATSITR